MSKSTSASAVISICLIAAVAIASIFKIADVPLPLIGKVSGWNWIELVIKFCSLLF
jgi:hypothetical protein